MKTKDRLKEEIGLHKLLMTITSAVAVSLISWVCSNFDYNFSLKFLFAFVGILILTTATFVFLTQTINKIGVGELDHAH